MPVTPCIVGNYRIELKLTVICRRLIPALAHYPNMKKLLLVLASALLLSMSACSVSTPPIDTNIAGEAAGLYKGTITTESGEVLLDEEVEMHRVADDKVSVDSKLDNNNNTQGRFSGLEIRLMRSGAVIHHQLGTEQVNGTFVLDAAITPDELRINLPSGLRFSGVRIKNYHE